MDTLVGTEIKLAVRLESDGLMMDDYDFACEFFTSPSKIVRVEKGDMTREDADCYVAVVDTQGMASGELLMKATAWLPDGDAADGLRTEVVRVSTDVAIKRR